jgi:2-polyprenyl-3-methyl-5-hydroxy-6-metoxy-1,4-benzoquinol methylase
VRAKIDPLRPVRIFKKDILALYREAGSLAKILVRIKMRRSPILRLERYVPDKGEIVDLGCGNGLFTAVLKSGAPARTIVGIDLDARKISAARKALGNLPHLDFRLGDISAVDYPPADVFTIVDVLFLVPVETQDRILGRCAKNLRSGGRLVLKEMDKRPRLKYFWNILQKTAAIKIGRFAFGSKFHFRDRADIVRTLTGLGLKVDVVPLHRGYAFPHILFLAKKP